MTEDPTHDAEGKSGLKSDDSFTIEVKGSKSQVKSEIDAQINRRQVCTRFYAKTRLKDIIEQALKDRSHRLQRKGLQRGLVDSGRSYAFSRATVGDPGQ